MYQVSNFGRVKSLPKEKWNGRGFQKLDERIMKCTKNNKGYVMVMLQKNGKKKNVTVHRLVALTFLDNPNNLSDVNHKDENKENNRVDNLEWISHKDNCNYGNRNKILRDINLGRCGEKSPRSIKIYCLELDMVFCNSREASEYIGVNGGTHITACCKGRRKTCRGYHFMYYEDYLLNKKQTA